MTAGSVTPEATPALRIVSSMAPGVPVNPNNFVGQAWIETLSSLSGRSRLYANIVTFEPGARTNWHSHTIGQVLHVLSGVGRVQCQGQSVIELRPGQTANIAAGILHWHGAAPHARFVHLAIAERDEKGNASIWGDPVAQEDYFTSPSKGEGNACGDQ